MSLIRQKAQAKLNESEREWRALPPSREKGSKLNWKWCSGILGKRRDIGARNCEIGAVRRASEGGKHHAE